MGMGHALGRLEMELEGLTTLTSDDALLYRRILAMIPAPLLLRRFATVSSQSHLTKKAILFDANGVRTAASRCPEMHYLSFSDLPSTPSRSRFMRNCFFNDDI